MTLRSSPKTVFDIALAIPYGFLDVLISTLLFFKCSILGFWLSYCLNFLRNAFKFVIFIVHLFADKNLVSTIYICNLLVCGLINDQLCKDFMVAWQERMFSTCQRSLSYWYQFSKSSNSYSELNVQLYTFNLL